MTTAIKRNYNDLSTLLELANATGCQMEQKVNRPSELRGFCPFHAATTLTNARTLTISPTPPRYRCEFCRAQGNPSTFAARLWRVSIRDAQELLLNAADVGPDRPPFPDDVEPRTNNSAVMTRANAHYGENLYKHYFPLLYLAQIGVNPDDAQRAGIGYSDGASLLQYLQQTDVADDEISASPLFLDSGGERFAGRITIADRDHTGGAVWICSTTAQVPSSYAQWPPRRPSITGLRCSHPYMLGLLQVQNRPRLLIITNDPRIYIICKSVDMSTIMITTPTTDAAAIAENIANKEPQRISVVINGRDQTEDLRKQLSAHLPNTELQFFGGPALSTILNPATRDLKALSDFSTKTADEAEPSPDTGAVDAADSQESSPNTTAEAQPASVEASEHDEQIDQIDEAKDPGNEDPEPELVDA